MKFRAEVRPYLVYSCAFSAFVAITMSYFGTPSPWPVVAGLSLAVALNGYMLYFFRDPDMVVPTEDGVVVSGASGVVAQIKEVYEETVLKTDTVRVSIFLSLIDVHVNRAPIAGEATFLGYFPGKRLFTFKEKSSEVNQHNSILIRGEGTAVLVKQIVGPVARRVVYFLDPEGAVTVLRGDRIGMMKFGSRLDMYFPKGDVSIVAKLGEQVHAGESVIARLRKDAHE